MSQLQETLGKSLDVQSDFLLHKISKENALEQLSMLRTSLQNKRMSETTQTFLDSVEASIKTGAPETIGENEEASDVRMPMRYIPNSISGHVDLLPIHFDGLVHGAIIRKKEYNIVCYAHRWFDHVSERYAKKWRMSESYYKEEVAGLFEKYNKDGISLGHPTRNVTLFKDVFVNASSPSYLDKNCVSQLHYFGPRKRLHKIMKNSWFYLPHHEENAEYFKSHELSYGTLSYDLILNKYPHLPKDEYTEVIHEDNGVLNTFLTGENFKRTFQEPDKTYESDNLLCVADAKIEAEATSGFVVNSPYIKVFSLSPDHPETIVSILNAYRNCSHKFYKGNGKKIIESKSKWTTHLIKS